MTIGTASRTITIRSRSPHIGAWLPALLPFYIDRWSLSKTEAGWLVGTFFAACVVMVPLLVALTDRISRPTPQPKSVFSRAGSSAKPTPSGPMEPPAYPHMLCKPMVAPRSGVRP